ncbi:uncharacterized protein J4E88_004756 [Alternaria novae-zelandiae]|uniref:uncharacterized protein n=1 Tax=Alternaria novae-zelandiae TaxID=430562 RepID=UPI0020C28609|nr:uncharacterized protein J4E88_004756 [Alternaria novae-zelandiae]KAI4683580.1 hypothetical protein J4E88_004756 [Alternaria novae-zelandiae]
MKATCTRFRTPPRATETNAPVFRYIDRATYWIAAPLQGTVYEDFDKVEERL